VKSGTVFDEILITDDVELAASARTKHAQRKEKRGGREQEG